jgi:hypothetical protein
MQPPALPGVKQSYRGLSKFLRHWEWRSASIAMQALAFLPHQNFLAGGRKAVLTALYPRSNFPPLICQESTAIVCFAYSSCRITTIEMRPVSNTGP